MNTTTIRARRCPCCVESPHPYWLRCAACQERVAIPRLLPATVPCGCGAVWRIQANPRTLREGEFQHPPRLLVNRERPGDMLKDTATQAKADELGQQLTTLLARHREATTSALELYRRYVRDCAAAGLIPVDDIVSDGSLHPVGSHGILPKSE